MSGALAFDISAQVVFSGAMRGLVLGVLAVAVILIYRSSRVINFAIGELGALGAALLVRLVVNWNWNWYLGFAVTLLFGALLGAVLELGVVRRLFRAPRVVLFVATLGAAQLFLFLQFVLPDVDDYGAYPTPFDKTWEVGGVIVRSEHALALVVIPLVVAALAWFLNRSRYGLAVRASADNPDAARLAGISVKAMSTVVWTLAGALATLTVVLAAPMSNATTAATIGLGPGLLLRTLTAALIARMRSFPVAIAAGVGIGVFEAVLFVNHPEDPGLLDAALLVIVLVTVLIQGFGRTGARDPGVLVVRPPRAARPPSRRRPLVGAAPAGAGLGNRPPHRGPPAPGGHRGVPPLPLQPRPGVRPPRPVPHGPHRLDRAALARPGGLPRPRGDDHLHPRGRGGSRVPERPAAGGGRHHPGRDAGGDPGATHDRAVPGRHHPRARRGRAVAALPPGLRRGPLPDPAAPPAVARDLAGLAAGLLLRVPRGPGPGHRGHGPHPAQRPGPDDVGRAGQRAGRRCVRSLPRAHEARRLRDQRLPRGPGRRPVRRAPRVLRARAVPGHRLPVGGGHRRGRRPRFHHRDRARGPADHRLPRLLPRQPRGGAPHQRGGHPPAAALPARGPGPDPLRNPGPGPGLGGGAPS